MGVLTSLSFIQNSRVLVRVGFDIPDMNSLDRIYSSLPTINQLLHQNNSVILVSKWGKIDSNDSKQKFSLKSILPIVEKALNCKVEFVNQTIDNFNWKQLAHLDSKVILLENTHFMEGETSTSSEERMKVAKLYASCCNFFVDECFISSHRLEATNTEIKELLPWCTGLEYSNEVQHLDKLKTEINKPFIVVMGGAKLSTKLPLIQKLAIKCDKILVGGMLAFTLLQASKELGLSNIDLGKSKVETDLLPQAKKLIQEFGQKMVLPFDFNWQNGHAMDLGKGSLKLFEDNLVGVKTVFWNGPLGQYEIPQYRHSTVELATYLSNLSDCYSVIGGGDTGASLPKNIQAKIGFVSMGGGATLAYLGT